MKINAETIIYIILGLGALIVKLYSESKQKAKPILESPKYDFEKTVRVETKVEPTTTKIKSEVPKPETNLEYLDSDIYMDETKKKERKFKMNYRDAIIFSEILKRPNF